MAAVLGSALTTTAGNKTVTATPTVGDLIVIITVSTGVTTTVADNGTGGTYTQVGTTRTGFSTSGNLQIFIRDNIIASAVSTVYTATQTSSTGGGLVVLRVTGVTATGAAAVRSSGGQSTGTSGTTPAPVLSLTPSSLNPIITAVANASNSTSTLVPRTGYTEGFDNGYNTPATGLEVNYIASGETSATLTQGGTSGSAFASQSIELILNTSPTTALNTPADAATGVSTTPDLNFTGTDAESNAVEYEVQVDPANTFNSGGGYALQFDGSQNYLSLGTLGNLGSNLLSENGLYLKFDIQTTSTAVGSFGAYTAGTTSIDWAFNQNFQQVASNHDLYFQCEGQGNAYLSGGTNADTTVTFNDGNVHTIEVTWNFSAKTIVIKIDGVTQTTTYQTLSAISSTVNLNQNFYLGVSDSAGPSAGSYFACTIDNFMIGTSASKIYASYVFSEGTSTTVADVTGNGNTATLLSGAGALPSWVTGFGAQLYKFSIIDAGFTAGHPFTSGVAKDFTVQVADALLNSTTYYWRVRAKDPTGSNAYGAWATTRSFTTAALISIPNKISSYLQAVNRSNTY